jgi:tRNA-specific 2-thiouridylase
MPQAASTTVIVGMSGGVDSSVAALLLMRAGYRVEGLFMKIWDEDDGSEYCTARADLADAMIANEKVKAHCTATGFALEKMRKKSQIFI